MSSPPVQGPPVQGPLVRDRLWKRFPWALLLAALGLMVLGFLAIDRYDQLVGASGRMVSRQAVWAGVGLTGLLAMLLPRERPFCHWAYLLYGLTLVLLVLVLFFPPIHHARRWIQIGSLRLQPSEFAKAAYLIALARMVTSRNTVRRFTGLLAPLALTLAPIVLIAIEPDLGSALVFLPVWFAVVFIAGARKRHLLIFVLLAAAAAPVVWQGMSHEQQSRVTALFETTGPDQKPSDQTYQLDRAKRLLALGGTWGSYFSGQTVVDASAYRLPAARTDFIVCVVGERFGLLGLGALLALYGLLVWRGLVIAARAVDPYDRLLVTGIVALLAVEATVNTAMTVGLLPITGLSLPLVSYGGSGLVAHLLLLGLVTNVALRNPNKKNSDRVSAPHG